MFNKFMKGLLSISACMCLVGSPVLAAESNGISDEGKEYYQSEEYQKVLEEKVANSNDKQRRATTILSVPHYTQETSYYCGPASAQVLIKYVTGHIMNKII